MLGFGRMRLLFAGAVLACAGFLPTTGTSAAVRITEINYNPPPDGATLGDVFEFIELKNTGTSAYDLSGAVFTSGIGFQFPANTSIGAGKFIVLVADAANFAKRYPGVTPTNIYTKKLSNSGEKIRLSTSAGAGIDSVTYGTTAPWPTSPDGAGNTLVPKNANPTGNASDPAYWRASSKIYGSPGADDPAPAAIPAVVINEALVHTDWPQVDAVELFNPTGGAANVGGWYLTDNLKVPKKFRIPDGTTVPANGYTTILGDNDSSAANNASLPPQYFGKAFELSSNGEEVYLFSADAAGNLTGYSDGFSFDASDNGVSFGRFVATDGTVSYPPQKSSTIGAANAGPRVGPIVISEIMYHPQTGYEFLELCNISPNQVQLYDHERVTNTWKITNVGSFIFPAGITLVGGEVVLLVSDSIAPETFRQQYSVPATVKIYSFVGHLSGSSQTISVKQPLIPFVNDSGQNVVPYALVDRVTYKDVAPWPVQADGQGPSLERVNLAAYGIEPTNWRASAKAGGSPGTVDLSGVIPRPSGPRAAPAPSIGMVRYDRSSRTVTVAYSLNGAGRSVMDLVDIQGRSIVRLSLEGESRGIVRAQVPDHTSPASGMLLVRVRSTNGAASAVQCW